MGVVPVFCKDHPYNFRRVVLDGGKYLCGPVPWVRSAGRIYSRQDDLLLLLVYYHLSCLFILDVENVEQENESSLMHGASLRAQFHRPVLSVFTHTYFRKTSIHNIAAMIRAM